MERLNEKTINEIQEARKRISGGEIYTEDNAKEILFKKSDQFSFLIFSFK